MASSERMNTQMAKGSVQPTSRTHACSLATNTRTPGAHDTCSEKKDSPKRTSQKGYDTVPVELTKNPSGKPCSSRAGSCRARSCGCSSSRVESICRRAASLPGAPWHDIRNTVLGRRADPHEVIAAVAAVLANALAVALRVALVAGSRPDVRIVGHRPLVMALRAPDRIAMGWRLRCGLCGTLASWLPLGCWGCALGTRHAERSYISHAHAVRPETQLGTKHTSVPRERPSVGGVIRSFQRHAYNCWQ
jgi:hypothetical protein